MSKKLFKVNVNTDIIVWAEDNNKDIFRITRRALQEHISSIENSEITFEEINSLNDIPEPWDKWCLPYGDYEKDITIKEILQEKKND